MPSEEYAWRGVTLTLKRKPRALEDVTIEALQRKLESLGRMTKHLWKSHIKESFPGSAMYGRVEIAGSGHVHAHLLIYSGYLPKKLIEAIVQQVEPSAGFVWIEKPRTDLKGLAREFCKYVTKSPSPQSEDWLAGDGRKVMHPTLAARWEIATLGRHMSWTYGALRGKKAERKKEHREPEVDVPDHCGHCGVCDEMVRVELVTPWIVRHMHDKGMRAMKGSRWTAPVPSG